MTLRSLRGEPPRPSHQQFHHGRPESRMDQALSSSRLQFTDQIKTRS